MNDRYLNAAYFVLQPSEELYEYNLSLLRVPGLFDSQFSDQNLLNYAHRREGNVPWKNTWNIRYPTIVDLKSGCASLHEK